MSQMKEESVAGQDTESEDHVVVIKNIRKEYPGVVAVNNVDLSIREGEFFTLLGPSGSGKTTLLQLISGIETPTSGDIFISGQRVNDVKPYNRNTALVFQEYALFPHLTAQENIEYGLKLRGVDKEERNRKAKEMFKLMDLEGKEDRKVTELSGGERQRVATARGLVIEPDVLLLDEVLGSLDEKLAKEMQVELKRLQEEIEKTFVFVTHSQEEAFSMSDRIGIMHQGNLVQVGSPLEVYQNPKSEFVADFLGVSNILSGTVDKRTDNELTIKNDLGSFKIIDQGETPVEGDEVAFFIPNERLSINGSMENQLTGVLEDTIFKGSHTEYAITIGPNSREFRVHESTGDSLYEEGTELTISFEPSAAKLLR